VFAGRGANETERLRGYILASFATVGLPPEAVPYVLEELETGRHPYTVAAAGRALRGAVDIPPEGPLLVVRAIARLRDTDDQVSFDRFAPAPASPNGTTALSELAGTLSFLGAGASAAGEDLRSLLHDDGAAFAPAVRAELATALKALTRPHSAAATSCCGVQASTAPPSGGVKVTAAAVLGDLALEDQDGARLTFAAAFSGRPTALAFFYTRCTNPEKCSLTVTRLARLARRIDAEALDANVAALTYDPTYDRPTRLRAYGTARGMEFSPRCALFRTIGTFDPIRDTLDLGVGFGPSTINRHRIELIVLDASLAIAQQFTRRLWQEQAVLDTLRDIQRPKRAATG
jgi:protein SCO1/2